MKRFFLALMVLLVFTFSTTSFALAEEDVDVSLAAELEANLHRQGDIYRLADREGQPTKHWDYMSQEEVMTWTAKGWRMYTGFLWYDQRNQTADMQWPATSKEVVALYEGHTFQCIYHWLLPAEIAGTAEEVSVYVGRYILGPKTAEKYFGSYVEPARPVIAVDGSQYYSLWYYQGQEAEIVGDEEFSPDFTFVRFNFDFYDVGYGDSYYLATGNYRSYTYEEALQRGEFENEMPHYNEK